jgi:carboxylesterase type B
VSVPLVSTLEDLKCHLRLYSLFLNIACPPSFPSSGKFPVKVYIHGG